MVAILEVINKYVAYLRTSTKEQVLGIKGQKEKIDTFVKIKSGSIIKTFIEKESGLNDDRPELKKAIKYGELHKAILLVSSLDRLTRKEKKFYELQEEKVKFQCCDSPDGNPIAMGFQAIGARMYVDALRINTKAALGQIKKIIEKDGRYKTKVSGRFITRLGNTTNIKDAQFLGGKKSKDNAKKYAAEIMPIINEIINVGKVISLYGIAAALNARGIKTSKKKIWWPTTVKNVMERSL